MIGTDGRYSTIRKRGAFTELPSPQHFDVLNCMVPFPAFWPDRTTVRLELGPGCITGGIPTADDRLWVGMTIPKGQYKDLRAAGPDVLTEELLRHTSPDLAAHLQANAEALKHPVLLNVIVGRLERWAAPGLLLLGDAAHPMSPIGGQGINMALRDALVAANHLCPVLRRGAADLDAAARQVEAERMPEIVAIQDHQRKQALTFLRSLTLDLAPPLWGGGDLVAICTPTLPLPPSPEPSPGSAADRAQPPLPSKRGHFRAFRPARATIDLPLAPPRWVVPGGETTPLSVVVRRPLDGLDLHAAVP